jgi:hypothetical protein
MICRLRSVQSSVTRGTDWCELTIGVLPSMSCAFRIQNQPKQPNQPSITWSAPSLLGLQEALPCSSSAATAESTNNMLQQQVVSSLACVPGNTQLRQPTRVSHCCSQSSAAAALAPVQLEPQKCYLVGVGPGSLDLCTVRLPAAASKMTADATSTAAGTPCHQGGAVFCRSRLCA